MTATAAAEPDFRRAAFLMTATSFLIPLGGLFTAPILANALGVDGRGLLAASLAPSALMLGAATLGLPDAVAYHVARRPSVTRKALVVGSVTTAVLGGIVLALTALGLPLLSDGDAELAGLILFASSWTIPALVVGVFRGAAIGRQRWWLVVIERVTNTALRVACFLGLLLADQLTVFTAVVVNIALPIIAGLPYLALLGKAPRTLDLETTDHRVIAPIIDYGSRTWLGSVASMLLSRLAPLVMIPLSTAYDLGLYTVATTISDLPLVVALAIQGALFGVSSRSGDAGRVTTTSRLTLLAALIGCALLGLSLPLWIGPLFGDEFVAATVPTLILLLSAVICVPGLMAAASLGSWGRPGLRSMGLAIALVVNLGGFLLLVPALGVYGACWTSLITNVIMTAFMVGAASRVVGVPASQFLVITGGDFRRGWQELRSALARIRRRPRA